MNENKDKGVKEKDKDKDHDRSNSVLSHFADAVGVGRKNHIAFGDDCKKSFSASGYKGNSVSAESLEILTFALDTNQWNNLRPHTSKDDQAGTQRVYKKSSQNSFLTLYLPTRELISCGSKPAILKGILFVDPKHIQGHRVYAQLTLTFRYGREDEEVMGLRFCNEAIMSLHQVLPRNEDPPNESLTPLQDALIKRLGDGAFPFTLSLISAAPPSVQLVPAKRYYGAPIGTSYDVRCFVADKADEKFHRRATVRMGIRVIHRTDVFQSLCPENYAALVNNQSPPQPSPSSIPLKSTNETNSGGSNSLSIAGDNPTQPTVQRHGNSHPKNTNLSTVASTGENMTVSNQSSGKMSSKKLERADAFPKIRLSPKAFRFSSRFGRSKSEVEKGPSDPYYNYSKSFHEYDTCGGPQGAVDKPFLLQEGRVCLRASLDKSWYTHGEDIIVTVNIKNESRKTVRRIRVCAIQHVDVCMFNNGKFKNIVADSDANSSSDRTVSPGNCLNLTIILRPARGPTKNWIALEDSLQRSSEPDEIVGCIAASAVRTPTFTSNTGSAAAAPSTTSSTAFNTMTVTSSSTSIEERNVFAIYVSYYVKVKLTLSGMGGELSLKLPFSLVHIDMDSSAKCQTSRDVLKPSTSSTHTLDIKDMNESIDKQLIPLCNRTVVVACKSINSSTVQTITTSSADDVNEISKVSDIIESGTSSGHLSNLNRIDSIEEDIQVANPSPTAVLQKDPSSVKRKLVRHSTIQDGSISDDDKVDDQHDEDSRQTTNSSDSGAAHKIKNKDKKNLSSDEHSQQADSGNEADVNDDADEEEERPRDEENVDEDEEDDEVVHHQQTTCVQIHNTTSS